MGPVDDSVTTDTKSQSHKVTGRREVDGAARVAGSILDGTDTAAVVGARTEGLAGRETIRRCSKPN